MEVFLNSLIYFNHEIHIINQSTARGASPHHHSWRRAARGHGQGRGGRGHGVRQLHARTLKRREEHSSRGKQLYQFKIFYCPITKISIFCKI